MTPGTGFKAKYLREVLKLPLRWGLKWKPLRDPSPGYSVVIGVPWDLKHLLRVNLAFVAKTRSPNLRAIHVVFDRCLRPEMPEIEKAVRGEFAGLPLQFHRYAGFPGWWVEKLNISTFYNSLNTVTALAACQTRYAILHDFDLFPLNPDYFEHFYEAMKGRGLHFAGLEHTYFNGLEPSDGLLGTWGLGMDVAWLREQFRPVDCFHRVAKVNGRDIALDPYGAIQARTDRRGLVETVGGVNCCHADNLCSTYLRFVTGRWVKAAWRLHYLAYLEECAGFPELMEDLTRSMTQARGKVLDIRGRSVDFSDTDATCANVLRQEIQAMDTYLFGSCREKCIYFADAFEGFLSKKP